MLHVDRSQTGPPMTARERRRASGSRHRQPVHARLNGAPASESLYHRVLGSRAATLPPDVAALHLGTGCTRAAGSLRVRRGRSPLARVLAVLLRLPRAGEAVPVALEIARHGSRERWWRRFDAAPLLVSTQRADAHGVLHERYGPLELRFASRASRGGLRLDATGARIGWGLAALPLPRVLVPDVVADVWPSGGAGAHVRVRIAVPFAGPLLAYEGCIRPIQEQDR